MTMSAGLYPARKGVDSHGVLLLIRNNEMIEVTARDGSTGTPDWLPVAQVINVSSPKLSKTFHDVTPSIPGAWKQVVPGYKNPGSIMFNLLFDPVLGSHSYLLESYRVDRLEEWRLVVFFEEGDSNGSWGFNGYVGDLSTFHDAGGIISGTVTVRLSGEVTFTNLLQGSEWPDIGDSDVYSYQI